jgi:CubicO group peptidase (beta-lactamase class C family)
MRFEAVRHACLLIGLTWFTGCAGQREVAATSTAPATRRPAEQRADPQILELERLIDAAWKDMSPHVAGLAVSVLRGGVPLLEKGYGLADLENSKPMAKDSIFRIGSITKHFTAAGMVKFAADGKFDLDQSLSSYLPEYPEENAPITLRQLLTHTSGIGNPDQPPLFAPGTSYSYGNPGYFVLGKVLERMTGRSYAELIAHQLVPPELDDIRFCPDRETGERQARGYTERPLPGPPAAPGRTLRYAGPVVMSGPFSAGGLCASAVHLTRWMHALGSGHVLGARGWQELVTPARLLDGTTMPYGFGLRLERRGRHRLVSHSGSIAGFMAELDYYPDQGLAIAVLVNSEWDVAWGLSRLLGKSLLGLPDPGANDLAVTPAEGARIAGTYRILEQDQTFQITWNDAGLYFTTRDNPERRLKLRRQDQAEYWVGEEQLHLWFVPEGKRPTHVVVVRREELFRAPRVE